MEAKREKRERIKMLLEALDLLEVEGTIRRNARVRNEPSFVPIPELLDIDLESLTLLFKLLISHHIKLEVRVVEILDKVVLDVLVEF